MQSARRHTLVRSLAMFCALLVLAISLLSAFIRLSQAGLGCESWPQCYGSRLRQAEHGVAAAGPDSVGVVAARTTHRLLASVALLLVVAMVVASMVRRPRLMPQGPLALALLALALGLAVLGRWSTGARVPAVAMGNLLGGALMLALCWRLATHRAAAAVDRRLSRWAMGCVALLVGQMALGALTSASYAGLSCADALECLRRSREHAWPWQVLDPWRVPVVEATALPVNPAGALAQLVHRGGALVTTLALLRLVVLTRLRPCRGTGSAVLVLLVLQLVAGVLMGVTGLALPVALAHNLFAVMLLALVARLI